MAAGEHGEPGTGVPGEAASSVVSRNPGDVVAALEEGAEVDVRLLAQKHTKRSIQTLVRAQRRPKRLRKGEKPPENEDCAPWHVSRQAAKDLLDLGHGRPDTRSSEGNTAGLTVIIDELNVSGDVAMTLPGGSPAVSEERVPSAGEIVIDVDPVKSAPAGVESIEGAIARALESR